MYTKAPLPPSGYTNGPAPAAQQQQQQQQQQQSQMQAGIYANVSPQPTGSYGIVPNANSMAPTAGYALAPAASSASSSYGAAPVLDDVNKKPGSEAYDIVPAGALSAAAPNSNNGGGK
jgi:hypothetical protein